MGEPRVPGGLNPVIFSDRAHFPWNMDRVKFTVDSGF